MWYTGDYRKFTYDEYIELADKTYMRKMAAYKKLIKYLESFFGKISAGELPEIENYIYTYFLLQQMDKKRAMSFLERSIKNKYIVDDGAYKIYEDLIELYSNVAKEMPQWDKKGKGYIEI